MNKLKSILLAGALAISHSAHIYALVAPDPPTIKESRVDALCSFLLDYEVAQLAFTDIVLASAVGRLVLEEEMQKKLSEQIRELDRVHKLACTFALWDSTESIKESCKRGQYQCLRYVFLRAKPLAEFVVVKYKQCSRELQDSLVGNIDSVKTAGSWFSTDPCPDLVQSAATHLKNLRFYLKAECEKRKNDPCSSVKEIESKIAIARSLEPTFAAVSKASLTYFSHYLCAAYSYMLQIGFELNKSGCYQKIIDDYIAHQVWVILTEEAFSQMCTNVDTLL